MLLSLYAEKAFDELIGYSWNKQIQMGFGEELVSWINLLNRDQRSEVSVPSLYLVLNLLRRGREPMALPVMAYGSQTILI